MIGLWRYPGNDSVGKEWEEINLSKKCDEKGVHLQIFV